MYILIEEVEKILEVMKKFPDAASFFLESDSTSGIGSTVTLTVRTQVNGFDGTFKTEISGVENW
jgi:hypothetical protein